MCHIFFNHAPHLQVGPILLIIHHMGNFLKESDQQALQETHLPAMIAAPTQARKLYHMPFDQKVVHYLASLCRIQCTEKEEESLLQSLDKILNYIALLDEIDTSGVKPLSHVTESLHDAMRDDECGPPLGRQEYLQNAPAHTAGMIRVPPVLKN